MRGKNLESSPCMPVLIGFHPNFFSASMCAVNYQNFLVANASVMNTEVVKDPIKVPGRIPAQ
jgi:hypothetical protein